MLRLKCINQSGVLKPFFLVLYNLAVFLVLFNLASVFVLCYLALFCFVLHIFSLILRNLVFIMSCII